jgi:hypothetical protein
MASDPEENPTPEEQVAERSFSTALIQTAEVIGGGAVGGAVGGVTGALTSHWLQGGDAPAEEPLRCRSSSLRASTLRTTKSV